MSRWVVPEIMKMCWTLSKLCLKHYWFLFYPDTVYNNTYWPFNVGYLGIVVPWNFTEFHKMCRRICQNCHGNIGPCWAVESWCWFTNSVEGVTCACMWLHMLSKYCFCHLNYGGGGDGGGCVDRAHNILILESHGKSRNLKLKFSRPGKSWN